MFSPSDTTQKIENFPEICVSTFSETIIQKFSSLDGVEQIAQLCSANGVLPVYKINYKNKEIAFYRSMVGAPACAACFEEIIAMGAEKFVLFGSCGVLDDDKVKDHIIIPVSAVRDEGYKLSLYSSFCRNRSGYPLCPDTGTCFDGLRLLLCKGKTWTSDAIYRETRSAISERRAEGCIAVEMECASMLAVAKYRQIPFIQFLYGADSLSSDTWEIRDLALHGLTNAEKYMLLAFECGLALSN